MDQAHKINITICGDGGCGKSSITLRLVRSQWTHEYDPTIEDSYSVTRHIDGQTYHLSLTDTAGQEEYRGLWAASNLRSDAFLMVYDITNRESLSQLEEFNSLIDIEAETRQDAWDNMKGTRSNTDMPPLPPVKIVAGNKCDLQESRQVDAKTGLEWARRHNCGFMETSARNVVNIEETFALIVRRVMEARRGPTKQDARVNNLVVHGPGGVRRAPTAPLSPLPPMSEKNSAKPSKIEVFKKFWRKMKCWKS